LGRTADLSVAKQVGAGGEDGADRGAQVVRDVGHHLLLRLLALLERLNLLLSASQPELGLGGLSLLVVEAHQLLVGVGQLPG
jgi:hypothetical protein